MATGTGSYIELLRVVKDMLSRTEAFRNRMPPGVEPLSRIKYSATFSQLIGIDIPRPFALVDMGEYGSQRNTDGDQDFPLGASSVDVLLTDTARKPSDDQASFEDFASWFGAVQDQMQQPDRRHRYIVFQESRLSQRPSRTPAPKRNTMDDYWEVIIQFPVETGT